MNQRLHLELQAKVPGKLFLVHPSEGVSISWNIRRSWVWGPRRLIMIDHFELDIIDVYNSNGDTNVLIHVYQ